MADDELVGRRCKLTIAVPVATPGDFSNTTADIVEINGGSSDPETPGMRVTFKVIKTREKEPNPVEIVVSNLSETRRKSLQDKGVKLLLEAGYESTGIFRIASGDVRTADSHLEGPNWLTKIKCGDGERSFRYARAAESFAPGVAAADVVRYLARQLGVDDGNVRSEAKQINVRFDAGYVVFGPAQAALDKLLGSIGYGWYIADGALYILRTDDSLSGLQIPEVSPETGLIGSPEMGTPEKKGKPALIKFKSLLMQTRPGGLVRLKSRVYDGEVTVKKLDHDGDTHGGNWYTNIEGILHA